MSRRPLPVLAATHVLLAIVLVPPPPGAAQESGGDLGMPTPEEREAAERAPLFAGREVVEVTLRTDVEHIKDDRGDDFEEQPATLSWLGPEGDTVRLEVEVRTRGNFRREKRNCNFPPIRVNVRTSQAEGTLFEGEDKLKLVTPCNDRRDQYERYVLKEYMAYRLLNALTPESFRVRLLRVTYEDTAGEEDTRTLYAFVVESEERLAQRLGGVVREFPQLHPLATDADHATVVALFQYLIGNTDWSPVAFHNSIAVRDGQGRYLAVPYDFDFSGLVDARYAAPDPTLGIKDVRERLYRGFCREDADVAAVAARILAARPDLEAVVRGVTELEEDERRSAERYLEGFWETLESERRFQREIVRGCRSF